MPNPVAMQLIGDKQTANGTSSQLQRITLHHWSADTVVMCVVTGNSDDEYVARPQAGGRQSSDASSTLHSLLDSVINK